MASLCSVAYRSHDISDTPALTYSGASSPASSISSPATLPGSPASLEPFISEPGSPQSERPQGHIPRPRNAFIIFRSFFYNQTKENEDNINQNSLSCAAAAAWKTLPEDQKTMFKRQAEEEKLMHYKKHPNYVYTPLNRAIKRAQKKKVSRTRAAAPSKKDVKKPTKKHRSSLSRRCRNVKGLRSSSRSSSPDDSLRDKSTITGFVLLDDTSFAQDEECCDGIKTDGESQKRVDLQFGQRPDVSFTQLPPTPTDTNKPGEHTPYSSPIISELSLSTDCIPLHHNPGYPNWMYNELLGYGTPDTGLHAGWNPLQTTLNAYGDNFFNDDQASNDLDDFSRYVNYDNVDTTTTASDCYSFGADAAFSSTTDFPSLDCDGNWVGVQ